jgi:hypothetical protein
MELRMNKYIREVCIFINLITSGNKIELGHSKVSSK